MTLSLGKILRQMVQTALLDVSQLRNQILKRTHKNMDIRNNIFVRDEKFSTLVHYS